MKVKKKIIDFFLPVTTGIVLFLIFILLRIDFMIDLLDSLLVMSAAIGLIVVFSVFIVKGLCARNGLKLLSGATGIIAVLAGLDVGSNILMTQYYSATEYVEELAGEIYTVREREGAFPDDLTGEIDYDGSGHAPVGIFRKRPLFYYIQENKDGFVIGFPFSIWMIAYYDSISGTWVVDD